MAEDTVLETDVYNKEPGHAAKHNAVNAQVNFLTEQLFDPASGFQGDLSATLEPRVQNSVVTYNATGNPATETIPVAGGNLVKTYTYDASGNPTSCAWNFPGALTDYVETFTYDGSGNATGSTFAEV